MDRETFAERENERARRLLEFVRGELRNMYAGSRLQFTIDLFVHLAPEVRELIRDGKVQVPHG